MLPSPTSRKTTRVPNPASRRMCRSSSRRATPLPRRADVTAIDRISASSAAMRDMMKPTRRRPIVARWVTTLRSSIIRSISPSLQPRWNEAACSVAMAAASRGLASASTGSPCANQRVMNCIIGGAGGQRPAAVHRARADRAVLAVHGRPRRRRRAAPPSRCRAREAARPALAAVPTSARLRR